MNDTPNQLSRANGHERLGDDEFGLMNALGHIRSARLVAVTHSRRYDPKTNDTDNLRPGDKNPIDFGTVGRAT